VYKASEIELPSSDAPPRAHDKAVQQARSKLEELLSKQGEGTRTGDDSENVVVVHPYEIFTEREPLVKNAEKEKTAANVDRFSTLGSTEVRIIPSCNVLM
jgi:hypothetical protein